MTHIYRGIIMHYTFAFLFRPWFTFPRVPFLQTQNKITNVSFSDQHLFPRQTLFITDTSFSISLFLVWLGQAVHTLLLIKSCPASLKLLHNFKRINIPQISLHSKPMSSTLTVICSQSSSLTNFQILLKTFLWNLLPVLFILMKGFIKPVP